MWILYFLRYIQKEIKVPLLQKVSFGRALLKSSLVKPWNQAKLIFNHFLGSTLKLDKRTRVQFMITNHTYNFTLHLQINRLHTMNSHAIIRGYQTLVQGNAQFLGKETRTDKFRRWKLEVTTTVIIMFTF